MAVVAATVSPTYGVVPVTKAFTLNPIQVAATYDLATVAGGDIAITSVKVNVGTAVTGLVSIALTDNDAGTSIMSAAEGAVANLLLNTLVKTYSTSFILHSTKKLQYTIVGTGLTGTASVTVTYMPLVASGVTLT